MSPCGPVGSKRTPADARPPPCSQGSLVPTCRDSATVPAPTASHDLGGGCQGKNYISVLDSTWVNFSPKLSEESVRAHSAFLSGVLESGWHVAGGTGPFPCFSHPGQPVVDGCICQRCPEGTFLDHPDREKLCRPCALKCSLPPALSAQGKKQISCVCQHFRSRGSGFETKSMGALSGFRTLCGAEERTWASWTRTPHNRLPQ